MPGRPRKPSVIKKMQGTERKCRVNEAEPQPTPGIPPCPERVTGVAREAWDELAGQLSGMGVLTRADRTILELASMAYADLVEAREKVEELGVVVEDNRYGEDGEVISTTLRPNPAVAARNDAAKRLASNLAELGMTPAARSKVSVLEKPKKANGFADTAKRPSPAASQAVN